MPSNSSPISIPSYQKVLLSEINKSWEILTFNFSEFEQKPIFWYVLQCCIVYRAGLKLKLKGRPVDGGICLPPDHWLDHHKTQKFWGPNCLCPLLWMTDEEQPLTEAQIKPKLCSRSQGITSGNISQNTRMVVANILVSCLLHVLRSQINNC